jgi:hypothetical protein
MKTIKIIIERSEDIYSAYAENIVGVYGGGNTVQEAKESVLKSIELIKEYNSVDMIPKALRGEYKIEYKFDAESLLKYFKGIFTNAALEKITGINQKQLQHYSSGLKKPRKPQLKKIEEGLHRLAEDLKTLLLL